MCTRHLATLPVQVRIGYLVRRDLCVRTRVYQQHHQQQQQQQRNAERTRLYTHMKYFRHCFYLERDDDFFFPLHIYTSEEGEKIYYSRIRVGIMFIGFRFKIYCYTHVIKCR